MIQKLIQLFTRSRPAEYDEGIEHLDLIGDLLDDEEAWQEFGKSGSA